MLNPQKLIYSLNLHLLNVYFICDVLREYNDAWVLFLVLKELIYTNNTVNEKVESILRVLWRVRGEERDTV